MRLWMDGWVGGWVGGLTYVVLALDLGGVEVDVVGAAGGGVDEAVGEGGWVDGWRRESTVNRWVGGWVGR